MISFVFANLIDLGNNGIKNFNIQCFVFNWITQMDVAEASQIINLESGYRTLKLSNLDAIALQAADIIDFNIGIIH